MKRTIKFLSVALAVFIAVNLCSYKFNMRSIQEDMIAKAIKMSEVVDTSNYLFYTEENLESVSTKYKTNFDKEALADFATVSVGNYDEIIANDFIDIINSNSELGDLIVIAINEKASETASDRHL